MCSSTVQQLALIGSTSYITAAFWLLLDITGLKQNYCTAALYTGLHRKAHTKAQSLAAGART